MSLLNVSGRMVQNSKTADAERQKSHPFRVVPTGLLENGINGY